MNIPLNIDFLQILLHLLNFVILAGGLTFLLYRPIMNFLEKRQAYFAELEKENKESIEENQKLKTEYEEKLISISEELANQKRSAEKEIAETSARILTEAREKAATIIRTAEDDAEDRKEHILESAQTEIGELVVAATQKLLSDTVTPERNSALYDEFIRLAEDTVAKERAKKHDNK